MDTCWIDFVDETDEIDDCCEEWDVEIVDVIDRSW